MPARPAASRKFVVIAGNIGVGKSSLTRLLTSKLGWKPLYEKVEENPYIADFYQDMTRWSFQSQVFFLTHRFRHYQQIIHSRASIVHDRSIYEDAEIFAENLYRQGRMDARDYATYRSLLAAMLDYLPRPDLLIYLQAQTPTLLKRIRLRGRDYERNVPPEYIDQLNVLYEEWIRRVDYAPVLIINTDNLDFVGRAVDLETVTERILERLRGPSAAESEVMQLTLPGVTRPPDLRSPRR